MILIYSKGGFGKRISESGCHKSCIVEHLSMALRVTRITTPLWCLNYFSVNESARARLGAETALWQSRSVLKSYKYKLSQLNIS